VRLTIWQFLAIIGALVAGYLIYTTWFSNQDQSGWINNFNSSIRGDESRVSTTKQPGSGGSGATGDAAQPADPPVNVW
jgi:hypothetical protein